MESKSCPRRHVAGAAAVLLLALALSSAAAEDAKKTADQATELTEEKNQGKELIMLELERVGDSRDKRQTEGEADFSNREVPPEYLSLLQQLQSGEGAVGPADGQPPVQQYYIAKTPSGVISGGPLDRSPQRFTPAPGEPRPFRPRDPVLNAISRQNSELQAEYQRKAIRDQETVFLAPRGPVGADPPRAGPLALAGLYHPGAPRPQPQSGLGPAGRGQAIGLAAQPQPQPQLQAFGAHDARLRAALQSSEVIQSPQPQYISPQYVQQLQARGLAALSGGPASELSLVREAAQQVQQQQGRQPQQLQLQPAPRAQPQPQPQPQQYVNFQELTPAELRFVQRQQEQETAPPPGPRFLLQPGPQQLQAQLAAQQVQESPLQLAQREQAQAQAEEQYLRETTPGGPPPLPLHPARAPQQLQQLAPQPQPRPQPPPSVLQPSPLYLQQVQQLAEQQALARQQIAAQQQLQQHQLQQQQPTEEVQYIRQPQRYAAAAATARPAAARVPAPGPGPQLTTPRSSIYVSTATASPVARAPAAPQQPRVTLEQLLAAGAEDADGVPKQAGLPVVRLPANPKTLTQADLQQLIDAGFDVSPVPEARDPTASAYYRSSAAGDYQAQQAAQRFAPIVVPEQAEAPQLRLSGRQRQALLQAQEDAYLQAAQAAQARGARLGSSGN
ncbi:Titin [Frankliniella fusca]|uniref:Titin n=1 Tax=Frankliniella fusca TaxID=407009 RepID=A0AAE1I424_9NEOP|nr:Titin [Frankliniella fusca]